MLSYFIDFFKSWGLNALAAAFHKVRIRFTGPQTAWSYAYTDALS